MAVVDAEKKYLENESIAEIKPMKMPIQIVNFPHNISSTRNNHGREVND